MNRVQVWALAARPKTLIAGLSPALIGAALTLKEGVFDGGIFLLTLLTALCIQMGTNFTNDLFDFLKGADTAQRKGFLRVTQAGLVTPAAMKRAIVWMFGVALVCGSLLALHGGVFIALMLALYVLLSVLYTAGPFPLAYMGLGDVCVLLLYGPGAVLITYYLQVGHFSVLPLLIGLSPGALSMSLLVINNLRDIEEDRLAHKKTLIVRWGRLFGKVEFVCAMILAFMPVALVAPTHPFCLLTGLALIPAARLTWGVVRNQDVALLNPLFAQAAQLLMLFTFLFCVGWMVGGG